MKLSILDLYTIGIGPSSSHTVGPMRAAAAFAREAASLKGSERVKVELFGSLAMTGKGHGTDRAIVCGLRGKAPETVDPEAIPGYYDAAVKSGTLEHESEKSFSFNPEKDLHFNRRKGLDYHPNGIRFTVSDTTGTPLLERTYYSIGGGFIVEERERSQPPPPVPETPYPFSDAKTLVSWALQAGYPVSRIVLENEDAWRPRQETLARLDRIWEAMQACLERGCRATGTLPGGLRVQRRAPGFHEKLCQRPESALRDTLTILDWVNLYAIAVNEENAAGGRVVTAPTNGAAGIIPAVMRYSDRFLNSKDPCWHRPFLLTAGAIGVLFKENASISGADVGCQGEVGVACSMAAGALAEIMGGTPGQVENAAEIGMEHNLGLTCDPVGGLVQIPCIERNAMGAVKAINAARIALRGDGQHSVSLDAVIRTMRDTGKDMRRKYKETSRGGLAVNVVEC